MQSQQSVCSHRCHLQQAEKRQLRPASARRSSHIPRVATAEADTEQETYEVFLSKPLGLKFGRGRDGAAYVTESSARLGNTDDEVQPGDKIVAVSASFGEDVWEAKNFGQVIYAIKTRNGQVYLKLAKRNGDMSIFEEEELTDAEKAFKAERAGGNYSFGTKELQERNYMKRKEAEREREQLFETALSKFNKKDIEGALIDFENVLAAEPKNYVGDDFSRVTRIYKVTQYNIACCYSALKSVEAGIDALSDALVAGFDDFKTVRTDPSLSALREDPRFTKLIDSYDEPLFNTSALNALKSIFPFSKKK